MREEIDKARAQGAIVKSPRRNASPICKSCGQPKTKENGHSRYKGEAYCSNTGGRSVEEWLREKRAAEPKS